MHQRLMTKSGRGRSGLTLAEVAVSSLLVGLLIVTAMQSSAGAIRGWVTTSDKYRTAHLADQLIAEIVQNAYEEPDDPAVFGPESGESNGTRAAWDDLDDFHGWTSSPPVASDGMSLPEFTGWTRSATVRLAALSDPSVTPASDEGLKMIEVTVTAPSGQTLVRQALRSQWGQLDQEPLLDATWITSVNTSLTLQNGVTSSRRSRLPNSVEDSP